jgi:hypothetical protein
MEDLYLSFQPRWIPVILGSLVFLQRGDYMRLNADWKRDSNLKDQYHKFMKEYEELGHMEPIKSQDGRNTCYYLPHHSVFKETSSTTKTRVVFDGSTKTSNGVSLNDILQVGPTV